MNWISPMISCSLKTRCTAEFFTLVNNVDRKFLCYVRGERKRVRPGRYRNVPSLEASESTPPIMDLQCACFDQKFQIQKKNARTHNQAESKSACFSLNVFRHVLHLRFDKTVFRSNKGTSTEGNDSTTINIGHKHGAIVIKSAQKRCYAHVKMPNDVVYISYKKSRAKTKLQEFIN